MNTLRLAGSALLVSLLYTGCDSTCCQDVSLVQSVLTPKGNQTPVPIITGLPTSAPCDTELTADGSQSYDPDGEIVDYTWKLDGKTLTGNSTVIATLPCDGQDHQVCLSVTDNKGAKQTTCQTIQIDNTKLQPTGTCNIEPKITYVKADSLQYKFYCTESTYNGEKISTAIAATCEWKATKTFKGGNQDIHGLTGPIKWVNVNPDIFKSMDLTLTVKAGDCEKSITEHYLIPADLPY